MAATIEKSTSTDESSPTRSPVLGIVVCLVAVLAYLAIPALIDAATTAGIVGADDALPAQVVVPLVLFTAIALVAILAAATRRGRGWAIAALVIAVANNYSPIHLVISDVVRAIFG
jgi:hypothetical protein